MEDKKSAAVEFAVRSTRKNIFDKNNNEQTIYFPTSLSTTAGGRC